MVPGHCPHRHCLRHLAAPATPQSPVIEQEDAESKIKMLEIDIYRKELAYHSLKAIEKELFSSE